MNAVPLIKRAFERVRLVHYSSQPVTLEDVKRHIETRNGRNVFQQTDPHMKPKGLWVSCDDFEMNWREWCLGEDFQLRKLTHPHEVELVDDPRILRLSSAEEIDAFTEMYGVDLWDRIGNRGKVYPMIMEVDWARVAELYQGIVIAPYIWSRRHDGGCTWYYSWDCASGCIWDIDAIKSITLVEVAPEKQEELRAKADAVEAERMERHKQIDRIVDKHWSWNDGKSTPD